MSGCHRHPLLFKAFLYIKSLEFYTTIYANVKNMKTPVFNLAANWVRQRKNVVLPSASEKEIEEALSTLHSLAAKCRAAIMVPDLFPGSPLETIFIPATSGDGLSPTGSTKLLNETLVTIPALSAIGSALTAELERTGSDMVRYEFDDGAEAIAYRPEVQGTVLQATGLVLLND